MPRAPYSAVSGSCPTSSWLSRGSEDTTTAMSRVRRRDEGTGRNERLRLQGVAGELLSEGHQGEGHAALLRDAAPERGDQQHLLSHAERNRAPGMGRAGSRGVHVRAEGAPAHHAQKEAEGGRVAGVALLREGEGAGSAAWSAAVPAAAEPEEGHGPAHHLPRSIARGPARCARGPARVVVRRRSLRG